ncbi:MAG: MAS20 protein import receptor-domain-containing protein [Linnemannia elongata]|nr:MAG: MAS20 protein import receptor-domain-containing protein [Linnemannia elongata]
MKTSTIVAATVGTLAVATVGYAIYFDQKRRNDPEFRRKLKKEKKRAMKQQKEEEKKKTTKTAQSAEEALASIKEDDFPTSMEEREKFCMDQLSTGEALFTRGPEGYDMAAICFYKALKVYPAPAELVMVYQKTIPPEVFTLVMGMLSMDVHKKQEKYYTVFPPKDMNVKVDELPEGITAEGQKVVRRGLIATKDFAAGETVYSETPIISSLEPSLEGKEFCHYCLKQIVEDESKVNCPTCTKVVFCSASCEKSASTEFHAVLCTKDSEDASTPERSLYDYTKETNNKYPEMIAKFLVRMVHEETLNSGEEYNLFDHIERLRFLEVRPSAAEEKEIELLKVALGSKIPGIEEFINEERYLTLKGKLLYNAYGISTSLNADRSVEPSPEQYRSERDAPVVGAGFYRVTSYMSHSCEPNTKIAYQDHNNTLAVVATKAVKAGDELHVGFIDQKNGELSTEQRRQELFQHYRFKCMCPRCEAPEPVAVAAAVVAEAEVEAEVEVEVEVEAEAKAEVEAVEEVTA